MVIWITAVVFSAAVSFTYWGELYTRTEIGVAVGNFATKSPIDRLPAYAPDALKQQLQELYEREADNPDRDSIISALVDALIVIADSPDFNGDVHISVDLEGFYENGNPNFSANDLLVYTTVNSDGEIEYSFISFYGLNGANSSSLQALLDSLGLNWTGIEYVTDQWMQSKRYTPMHAPVYYEGKPYVTRYSAWETAPPPQTNGTWIELSPDLTFLPHNPVYFRNSIVRHNNQYYIAVSSAWHTAPGGNSSPWAAIDRWHSGNSAANRVVYTDNNGVRFWRALTATTTQPNEANARNGYWQELKNGWTGGSDDIRDHYMPHNRYAAGTVVIDGVSPILHYRYFRAVTAVPADEPPIKRDAITNQPFINTQYWELIS